MIYDIARTGIVPDFRIADPGSVLDSTRFVPDSYPIRTRRVPELVPELVPDFVSGPSRFRTRGYEPPPSAQEASGRRLKY